MRSIQFKKIKVIIDFEDKFPNFVSIVTLNNRLIASGEWDIDRETKNMHITDVLVQKRYRGKGYGSFLARIMIDIAKLYKLKTMSLIDGSTSEGFWQRLGFKWNDNRDNWVLDLSKVK